VDQNRIGVRGQIRIGGYRGTILLWDDPVLLVWYKQKRLKKNQFLFDFNRL